MIVIEMFGRAKEGKMLSTSRRSEERTASAQYLADMAAQCARLARAQGLDALGYLFDMANLEARNAAGERGPPGTTA
jgi:hypothetical protein